MATLKPVIVPGKALKGNKHKVRISVAHNGEFRYILTDIILNSVKEFKNGQIVKRTDAALLNTKLRGILQRYQSTLDELEYVNGLSCAELVFLIKNGGNHKHRTLRSIFDEYMECNELKPGTSNCYTNIFRIIGGILGENIIIDNISYSTVVALDRALRSRKISQTTRLNYMAMFASLINFAKKCGYVDFKVDPFANYSRPRPEVRQSWLTVEQIRRIRDFKTTKGNLIRGRDLFMLSYYLGGINMADLLRVDFNDQKSILRYVRKKTEDSSKTNKFVEFEIPKEAMSIIERYKGEDGKIVMTKAERENNGRCLLSRTMASIAKKLDIPNLIFYSARKSFAQHAFSLGVSTSVIDYILGHSLGATKNVLYHYIKVTPDMATEAVRKVLDNLK